MRSNQILINNVYLNGKSSWLSMPNSNNNVKNVHYQLMGGFAGFFAVIGNHMFDVMLWKMAVITAELILVDDFASNALVLQ